MVSMATRYMILKTGGISTKSIVSRVLLFREQKPWYQLEDKIHTFFPMVRYIYVYYLICIFMNINEDLKNEVKS